jgi:hypothetical protein
LLIATVENRRKKQYNRRYKPSGGYSDGLLEPPLNDLATPHLPTLANRRTWHLAAVLTAAVSFFEPPLLAVFSVV